MIRIVHDCSRLLFPKRFLSSTSQIIRTENLPSTAYKPEIVEKHKYEEWEKKKIFQADNTTKDQSYSLVLPPPNVTGKLHLGHALSCTIQDVIARQKRSKGSNVLWLPGTDHAGIATQGVVEKYLKSKENKTRYDIGRDKFNKEVWKWKEKHGNAISQQLRLLGCSLDWSREIFTMDENHTLSVNTAFIELFRKGLIYRKKALVNWCTALKSTVSDIEVENITVNGPTDITLPSYEEAIKFGLIYEFAYKLEGSNEEVVVSTTMPETMLGDTAIAVHPEDERYQHLKGKKVVHPFRKSTLPIIFDKFVDIKFGTGVVKVTPAHSKMDYEIARRHRLPLLQIINEDGVIQNSGKFDNMRKYECRNKILVDLDNLGVLKTIKPHQMSLPMCSRTGDVIEYIPKEQWFISCSKLNISARQAVIDSKLKIEPNKFVKTWLHWTEDDRDWCISRQLWWGHTIPAYKCSYNKYVVWIAALDENTAKAEASTYLKCLPMDIVAERDTDVLDTWFSSGLYPFASLGWPKNTEDLQKYYPLDLMVTGHDILGFWVHRMVILGLELTGKLPFNNVLLHGIICDSKGAKMSKSRGNIIDPIDVINGISMEDLKKKAVGMKNDGILNSDELNKALAYHKANFSNTNGIPGCGVDALRFTLLSQDIKSHYVSFDVYQCLANKLFCNKIWQSIRYTQLSFDKLKQINKEITPENLTYFDKWILSRLSNMVDTVDKSMDARNFHLATKSLKTHIYNEFCDIYLEATKSGFESENHDIGYAHAHTLSAVLNTSLRCLAPFMVYVTDEVIPKIPAFESNIIYNFKDIHKNCFDFPQSKDFKIWSNPEFEKQVDKVLNTVYLVREIKGFYNLSNKIKPTIYVTTNDKTLITDLQNNQIILKSLAKCGRFKINEHTERKLISAVLDKGTEISVEVTSDIENTIVAAKDKLTKKIRKMEENILKLENKLSKISNSAHEVTLDIDKEKLKIKKEQIDRLRRLI